MLQQSKRPTVIEYNLYEATGVDRPGQPAQIKSYELHTGINTFKEILAESLLGAKSVVEKSRYSEMSDETIAGYIKDGVVLESIPAYMRESFGTMDFHLFKLYQNGIRIGAYDRYASEMYAQSQTRNELLANGLRQYYQTSSIVHRDPHTEYFSNDPKKGVPINILDVDVIKTDLQTALKAELNEQPQVFSKVFSNSKFSDDLQRVFLTMPTSDFPNLVLSTYGITGKILEDSSRLFKSFSDGKLNTSTYMVTIPKEIFDQVTSYIKNIEAPAMGNSK